MLSNARRVLIDAVDNLAPVSRVAVYLRAGSRYEPDEVPGISHYVRACAGLTTQNSSQFGITRHTERAGASFKVTSDREYIVYRMDCLRDKLSYVLGFIDDTIHKPEFRSWELHDTVRDRLKEDLRRYKNNQMLVANEAMHKAAYRGGLAHSTFIPEHQIEKIKNTDCFDFVQKNFVLDRMSFVGLGVDKNELQNIIEERFSLNDSPYKGVTGETRYVGGEARIQADFPCTMVNFVVQGSPLVDTKSVAALELIATLLGGSHQRFLKYGDGPQKSLSCQMRGLSPQIKSSVININHTDTGLFGFSIVGPNKYMMQATKDAVNHVKSVMTSMKEDDLKAAKKALKARAMITGENQDLVFESMARRYAAGLTNQMPLDHVDKMTLKDVQGVVGNLLKSKPTIAAIGNPRFVPYLDELDS